MSNNLPEPPSGPSIVSEASLQGLEKELKTYADGADWDDLWHERSETMPKLIAEIRRLRTMLRAAEREGTPEQLEAIRNARDHADFQAEANRLHFMLTLDSEGKPCYQYRRSWGYEVWRGDKRITTMPTPRMAIDEAMKLEGWT